MPAGIPMRRRALVCAALVLCAALPVRASAQAAMDLSTPEAAVRSYWRAQDVLDSLGTALSAGRNAGQPFADAREQFYATLAGTARAVFTAPYVPEVFERTVESVDVLGADAAHVATRIRNVSPIPAGAVLTHDDQEVREQGWQIRYILQRENGGWRIARIQQWSDLGDGWQDVITSEPRAPVYPRW